MGVKDPWNNKSIKSGLASNKKASKTIKFKIQEGFYWPIIVAQKWWYVSIKYKI